MVPISSSTRAPLRTSFPTADASAPGRVAHKDIAPLALPIGENAEAEDNAGLARFTLLSGDDDTFGRRGLVSVPIPAATQWELTVLFVDRGRDGLDCQNSCRDFPILASCSNHNSIHGGFP